ncbi:hypothetical protein [Rhabdochromatium marinum]|uniref:hypothetical protein n=1 Tax=Rhabdochromatium marinum TaxID=48729 RepID=UPI0019040F29|nr:hypothetical protein [Rhabdochromatium marinum]MBK1650152.1 hypothetical protein [Rhabdochromatium marinum]
MEFFQELKKEVKIDSLKNFLRISALPDFCLLIESVISDKGNIGEIYCVWGHFIVSREVIKNGVRFSLLDCPHAFAWTITYHESKNMVVIHCTIDDQDADQEFAESIQDFALSWRDGLNNKSLN